jgi:Flp pilus assembly protein TadG
MSNKVKLIVGQRGQRGSVLALTAICMLALVLALALCLDISHFYSVETEMQNAADASALAGASALDSTDAGILLARQVSIAAMNNYEFNHNSINFAETNLYFATNFADLQSFLYTNSTCAAIEASTTPANVERAGETKLVAKDIAYVGVCMPAPANTSLIFAHVAGTAAPLIRGRAIAGKSPPLTGICDNVAPVSLLEDPAIPNSTEFAVGSIQILKRAGGGSVSPGNYQLLEICGPGGSNVEDALQGNCGGCFSIGSTVMPKTGATNGPTGHGWDARFDADVITTQDISHATYLQQYRDYLNGTIATGTSINANGTFGRRVLIVPVLNYNDVAACNGSNCTFTVGDFVAFFMQKKVSNGNIEVTAEFIGSVPIANGVFGGTPIPSLSITKTVLYR